MGHTDGAGCWRSKYSRAGEYLQVDLEKVREIRKVKTQGSYNADYWTTAFELEYRTNGAKWTRIKKVSGVRLTVYKQFISANYNCI